MASDPKAILLRDRQATDALARKAGAAKARGLLERAAADLEKRLKGLRAPGGADASFTETHLRLVLAQVKAALGPLSTGLEGAVKALGKQAAALSARATLDYAKAAEERFRGIHQPLAVEEAAVLSQATSAAESSMVRRIAGDPEHKGQPGVLARYGGAVMDNIENELALRFLAKRTWGETIEGVVAASPFLQGAPASWAERLVRTEVMGASNAAAAAGIHALDEQLGDMVKILSATFDSRTAADSYAVHGQVRKSKEPFDTWFGKVQHPPARPNDREVVVPHRISWPIPPELAPKDPGEVASRWAQEGHKHSMPAIPKLSTVDLKLFGKAKLKVLPGDRPAEVAKPATVQQLAPKTLAPQPVLPPLPHPIAPQQPLDEDAEMDRQAEQMGSEALRRQRKEAHEKKVLPFFEEDDGEAPLPPPPPRARPVEQVAGDLSAALGEVVAGNASAGRQVREVTRELLRQFGVQSHVAAANPKAAANFKIDESAVSSHHDVAQGIVFSTPNFPKRAAQALAGDKSPLAARGLNMVVHEELHGASQIDMAGVYQGAVGKGLEEGLTEIMARHVVRSVVKWEDREHDVSDSYKSFVDAIMHTTQRAIEPGFDERMRQVERAGDDVLPAHVLHPQAHAAIVNARTRMLSPDAPLFVSRSDTKARTPDEYIDQFSKALYRTPGWASAVDRKSYVEALKRALEKARV